MKPLFLTILGVLTLNAGAQNLPPALAGLAGAPDPLAWVKTQKNLSLPYISGDQVTFVYFDAASAQGPKKVWLQGEFNQFSERDEMTQLSGTKTFVKTLTLPSPDNQVYSFKKETQTGILTDIDPFNPSILYTKPLRSRLRTETSPLSTLHLLPGINPTGAPAKRDVWVYLPPMYFQSPTQTYPVVYLQDGQQVWDSIASAGGGWKADTAVETLLKDKKIPPVILVGVKNSSRRAQEYVGFSAYYGYKSDQFTPAQQKEYQDLSRAYADFLALELKPLIDRTYRTKPQREFTTILGSSFGAGISLYTALTHPQVYSRVGAFSGGNYRPDDTLRSDRNFFQAYPYLIAEKLKTKPPLKIYVDCGGRDVDAEFLPRTQDLIAALKSLGFQESQDLKSVIDKNAGHNEKAWAERLPTALEFLLN